MRYWIKVEDPFTNPPVIDIVVPGVVQVEGTFRLYTDDEVLGVIGESHWESDSPS